jgi:FG-GAP-like repeat
MKVTWVTKTKLLVLVAFVCIAVFGFSDNRRFLDSAEAFSSGPPPGVTGAPGESTCADCHTNIAGPGTFTITAPDTYTPGQTYQIVVRHISSDPTRLRWGFELTSLAATSPAGTFTATSTTQVIAGGNRTYIEHNSDGTFPGQTGGAVWSFNWTAPATNVGAVTFYAAGNQANNNGTSTGDRILTTTAVSQPGVVQPPAHRAFDFDGDGKTDISIFRPSDGTWWYQRSSDLQVRAAQFGTGTDKVVASDFTGDGKTDIAFFRPSTGEWFVLRSEDGSFFSFPFGTSGDIPMPADYDGDGKTDAAVFRPSSATWIILRSSDSQVSFIQFGAQGDQPVAADYDGDGKADIAIFRPSGFTAGVAEWWILRSSNSSVLALQFGLSTDKAVAGDYTGDGKADVAFFRPSNNNWFVLRSEDFSFFSFPWGAAGDVPVPGDYDGDGKTDAGVFRPSNATWFVNRSAQGAMIVGFGLSTDQPVPNAFVR